jgi:hypothetical protein
MKEQLVGVSQQQSLNNQHGVPLTVMDLHIWFLTAVTPLSFFQGFRFALLGDAWSMSDTTYGESYHSNIVTVIQEHSLDWTIAARGAMISLNHNNKKPERQGNEVVKINNILICSPLNCARALSAQGRIQSVKDLARMNNSMTFQFRKQRCTQPHGITLYQVE